MNKHLNKLTINLIIKINVNIFNQKIIFDH